MSTEIMSADDQLDYTHLSPTICVELAAGLISPTDVPAKFNLTDDQWERLKKTKFFIRMLQEAGEKFAGDLGAGKRITLKAEMLLEESLPVLDAMIHNLDGSTQSKLDSIKQLSVLAGRTQRQVEMGGGGPGFNVQIHINTGEEKQNPVIIEAAEGNGP